MALECNPVAATCGNTGISCIDGVAIEKPIENCALGFVCEEEVCVEHCASNDGCPEGSVCTWENKCLINEDSDFLNYFIDFEQLYGEEIQNAQTNGWNIKMVSRLANFFKLIFT